jgi:hypothetical protein
MTDSATPTRSAFSYRAFTMFLIGRIVSILSFQMLVVAIGWQLYTLTDSALDPGCSASHSSCPCSCSRRWWDMPSTATTIGSSC